MIDEDLQSLIRREIMQDKTRMMALIIAGRDYDNIPDVKEQLFALQDLYDVAAWIWVPKDDSWDGSEPDRIGAQMVRLAHEVY